MGQFNGVTYDPAKNREVMDKAAKTFKESSEKYAGIESPSFKDKVRMSLKRMDYNFTRHMTMSKESQPSGKDMQAAAVAAAKGNDR